MDEWMNGWMDGWMDGWMESKVARERLGWDGLVRHGTDAGSTARRRRRRRRRWRIVWYVGQDRSSGLDVESGKCARSRPEATRAVAGQRHVRRVTKSARALSKRELVVMLHVSTCISTARMRGPVYRVTANSKGEKEI